MTTQEQVKDVVSQVLADKADKGGIKRVVWIGAGGDAVAQRASQALGLGQVLF